MHLVAVYMCIVQPKGWYKVFILDGLECQYVFFCVICMWHSMGCQLVLSYLTCLRAGGASAAAQAGMPDRLFKQHGRWSSETAKDGYIEDSKENRLSVSQNIGI